MYLFSIVTKNKINTFKVLDVWCDKMACVTAPERRKLLALALASLLTTESPVVLSRYILFMNHGIFCREISYIRDRKKENMKELQRPMMKIYCKKSKKISLIFTRGCFVFWRDFLRFVWIIVSHCTVYIVKVTPQNRLMVTSNEHFL